jgi:hypothetical protein
MPTFDMMTFACCSDGLVTRPVAGGSHRIFRFEGRDFINLQDAGGMAKSYQVRQVRDQLSKYQK